MTHFEGGNLARRTSNWMTETQDHAVKCIHISFSLHEPGGKEDAWKTQRLTRQMISTVTFSSGLNMLTDRCQLLACENRQHGRPKAICVSVLYIA